MRSRLKRSAPDGIPYFYFDLADPSHQSLLKRARRIDPMKNLARITRIDEY
ncbi:hypothetical protein [Effusibacillus lacus]|uniref:hypothetical protein n=1 Tax=Effusibacillus lacus TaxID=1348429 RepID=UPI0010CFD6FE|nr:hypothetical protein [Effusibacillus lacus]TCS70635.1 hypothetical protein EDD64_13124 [Effusibacillus lacus]